MKVGSFLILLISLFTFLPSFSLALFGDDWLAIWRYLEHLGPKSPGQWNHLTYLLTPYGAQDILMGFLNSLYGFQSSYYYAISFVFRLFAAFTLYPLVFYLTGNKLATFFSILFFSITFVGLETTNWVFNMPSYITIGLFNLALYFYLRSREEHHFKRILFAAVFYFFAYIITPIRMHGSLPFLFLLEFFWMIKKRSFKTSKQGLLRFAIMFAVFLIIKFIGHSLGPSNEIPERITQGFNVSGILLNQGRFDFIFHPLIIFGGMFIPDFLIQQTIGISDLSFSHQFIGIIYLLFLSIIILLLNTTSKDISKKFFVKFLSLSLIWMVSSWIIFPKNIQPFPNNTITPAASFVLLSIGGYTSILVVLLLIEIWKKEKLFTALLIAFIWPFLSFLAAWWFTPQIIFPTSYRYLTFSAIGISIFFAVIISLKEHLKERLSLLTILALLIIVHIFSTNYYLRQANDFHSQQVTDKIWSAIPYISEVGKQPLVFYFEGDNYNYVTLHNALTFGFPPHMQLLYNLREGDLAPVPMNNWKDVVSAVKDGQSFKAYGYPLKPIPIDNIYAFHLQGKDNLINITDIARAKLIKESFTPF